ncbi:hypothetical protein BSU04_08455 [Caballeronia sordidicola]|uniref:Uncharacterized protein n=1 Tax=Caballeronia sordidicola TaxID=196367 RepID=A0A226X6Y9_CABSO|nr:hypothetical protein BSU04_08455 [Caballeronia sordidicola]
MFADEQALLQARRPLVKNAGPRFPAPAFALRCRTGRLNGPSSSTQKGGRLHSPVLTGHMPVPADVTPAT